MSRGRIADALMAGLLVSAPAASAKAEGAAWTQPFDPVCNHLKGRRSS
jgi:hypothetical protein